MNDYKNLNIIYTDSKTVSARIKEGIITIRMPRIIPKSLQKQYIDSLVTSLSKKIKGCISLFKKVFEDSHVDIFGHRVRLEISYGKANIIKCEEGLICFKSIDVLQNTFGDDIGKHMDLIREKDLRKGLTVYARKYLFLYIEENLYKWCKKLNINHKINLIINDNDTKWGSCSSRNKISISLRALMVPFELFDYVCLHEVAHILEKNHSQNFWKIVEEYMPNFRDCMKKLNLYI